MNAIDLLSDVLINEMANVTKFGKGTDKEIAAAELLAGLIRDGEIKKAVKSYRKTSGNPLAKSVPGIISSQISAGQKAEFATELKNSLARAAKVASVRDPKNAGKYTEKSKVSKQGPGIKASSAKIAAAKETATDGTGKGVSSHSQIKIKNKLRLVLVKVQNEVKTSTKLTDDQKADNLSGLDILSQALDATMSGKGVLKRPHVKEEDKPANQKKAKIALNYLKKNNPEEAKAIEKELADIEAEKLDDEKKAKDWKDKTGKSVSKTISSAEKSGALKRRYGNSNTIPKKLADDAATIRKNSGLK